MILGEHGVLIIGITMGVLACITYELLSRCKLWRSFVGWEKDVMKDE